METLLQFWHFTAFAQPDLWKNLVMISIGLLFVYLAIKKEYEPLLLVPIGFGIVIGNVPFPLDARLQIGVYEQGSTFKIFNTAMALDTGRVNLTTVFDATSPIKIDRFTINDYHGQNRAMTVADVFKFSSNIGSAKMALEIGVEGQRAFFDKIGFLKPVPVELPRGDWVRLARHGHLPP